MVHEPFSIDYVMTLSCPTWPVVAMEWVHRKRQSGWPTEKQISDILSIGCNVVPVAHHLSVEPDLEWRFSFSMAEKLLARSLTLVQRQVYLFFKLVVSQCKYLKVSIQIATYHMKTLMFWALEKIPAQSWTTDNIYANLLYLIDSLKLALLYHKLPNYFIRDNNMIDHIPRDVIITTLKSIDILRRCVVRALEDFMQDKVLGGATGSFPMFVQNDMLRDLMSYLEEHQLNVDSHIAISKVSHISMFNIFSYYTYGVGNETIECVNVWARPRHCDVTGTDCGFIPNLGIYIFAHKRGRRAETVGKVL